LLNKPEVFYLSSRFSIRIDSISIDTHCIACFGVVNRCRRFETAGDPSIKGLCVKSWLVVHEKSCRAHLQLLVESTFAVQTSHILTAMSEQVNTAHRKTKEKKKHSGGQFSPNLKPNGLGMVQESRTDKQARPES
jgi:hypothetical protein